MEHSLHIKLCNMRYIKENLQYAYILILDCGMLSHCSICTPRDICIHYRLQALMNFFRKFNIFIKSNLLPSIFCATGKKNILIAKCETPKNCQLAEINLYFLCWLIFRSDSHPCTPLEYRSYSPLIFKSNKSRSSVFGAHLTFLAS